MYTIVLCLDHRYKWGSVTHQSVGVVRSINRNGTDVCVDFPEQNNWTGLISEMELVPGIHPRHRYLLPSCIVLHLYMSIHLLFWAGTVDITFGFCTSTGMQVI